MSSFVHRGPVALAPAGGPAAWFDALAMGVWPWVARALGLTYRVGRSPELLADARAVHRAVSGPLGLLPPADVAWVGQRYDDATTWIVAYRGGRPVGVMGLLDVGIASIALDVERRELPRELDPARTREITRLAILPEARGGIQAVMVGLLREMLAWSKAQGVERLLVGSSASLYEVYRRYNPTVRRIDPPPAPPEDPAVTRYFEALRACVAGRGMLYVFDVDGASPWSVFSRFLTRRLRQQEGA